MKAITLYEPWASFIMWGWKTIETRTHKRFKGLVGETIAIHAAKKFDDNHDTYGPYLILKNKLDQFKEYKNAGYFNLTAGRIIGSVYVDSFRLCDGGDSSEALIDCFEEERYGLIVKEPQLFKTFIPSKGHQGIFLIPDEFIEAAGKRILKPLYLRPEMNEGYGITDWFAEA